MASEPGGKGQLGGQGSCGFHFLAYRCRVRSCCAEYAQAARAQNGKDIQHSSSWGYYTLRPSDQNTARMP